MLFNSSVSSVNIVKTVIRRKRRRIDTIKCDLRGMNLQTAGDIIEIELNPSHEYSVPFVCACLST